MRFGPDVDSHYAADTFQVAAPASSCESARSARQIDSARTSHLVDSH